MKRFYQYILVMVIAVVLSACAGAGGNRTTFEYMPDMMDQWHIKAQEEPYRAAPEGTVPVGYKAYPYSKEEGDMANSLQNPLAMTKENLLLGKKTFNTYCIVCHGSRGKGDGYIVPKFPMPPSLQSDKVRGLSDGRLFHIMTRGQNLMPSYASQTLEKERWATALYIRALQRSVKPSAEDVEIFNSMLK
ncbi:c-type cytochrome [bacterium]|nr:c-type cytochrome [bacterium]